MNTKKIGVLAILGASIMWAIEPILAKLSYKTSDFFHTSAIRALFAALIGLIYVLITESKSLKVTRKQLSKLVYISLVGTLTADLLYFFALTKTSVINAVLIGHMQPIFIVLIGFFILKDDILTKFDYTGIIIMILAGILVTTREISNISKLRFGNIGDLFVLFATFAWATTAIVMRKYLKNMNAGTLTFYRFSIASIVFGVYLLFTSSKFILNIFQILIGVIVGVGTILYYEGLKRIKAAQVSSLELSTPFFAALLGFFILGETVTIIQIFGIILMFTGVYFLSRKEQNFPRP